MGKKPAGGGQHLLFYLTGLIIILFGFAACTGMTDSIHRTPKRAPHLKETQGELDLAIAKKLMAGGYFKASLEKNLEVLIGYPDSLGDQALFQTGLIYAHPQNPDASFRKSEDYFKRLIAEFPESTLKAEAEIWVSVLGETSKNAQEIQTLKQTYEHDSGQLNRQIDLLEKNNRENEAKLKQMQSTIDGLQAEIENLKSQIDRLKNVDIGIQEKKRKASEE